MQYMVDRSKTVEYGIGVNTRIQEKKKHNPKLYGMTQNATGKYSRIRKFQDSGAPFQGAVEETFSYQINYCLLAKALDVSW